MNERDRELEAFSKFIGALEPWLCEVVLIGGWAHRLYRRHPLARRLAYLPLITLDGDVAVPPKLKARELSVRKRLLDAGFVVPVLSAVSSVQRSGKPLLSDLEMSFRNPCQSQPSGETALCELPPTLAEEPYLDNRQYLL